ncbi:MAG TPA: enoyl-CoA hydratase-related protein, partial [Spongiibacteraceae bacterium]|nr:enoyl-CoA hydratase-related protein [Spongiibacteraceae bacterium]
NSLNVAMARELLAAAQQCDGNPNVRAVLITGAGKMFSAGGDVRGFAQAGDNLVPTLREILLHMHAAVSCFARMNAPVIMAVNGMAAGAGFSLAISGDLVLVAESARFTMAYTGIGACPDGSASFYLPRIVGLTRARELMLNNRMLSAQEALDWGIATQVIADDALQAEALAQARKLAQGPTRAFGTVKRLLLSSFDNGLETQMEQEAVGITTLLSSADGREGVAAFLEKRKPTFNGR